MTNTTPVKPTCVTLFSGGGLKAVGAMNAGFDLVGAVEYDAEIAEIYRQNLGPHITVGKVEETDPTPYIGITALLASPVCTRMSIANANRGETEVDIVAAEGVCHWLRVTKPKIFVLENVVQYRASQSCKMIETCLSELGYFYTADNINCANYGVPQSRRRLIIRALLGSMVPALPVPEPHIGWYAAIEDLIPTLPESKFADWQLKRLPNDLFVTQLIEGDAAGNRPPTCRTSEEPCFTLKTSSGGRVHRAFLTESMNTSRPATIPTTEQPAMTVIAGAMRRPCSTPQAFIVDGQQTLPVHGGGRTASVRHESQPVQTVTTTAYKGMAKAWLNQGRVVSMTPRALARFMTLPDWYVLPEKKTLASKIIGNGFPCLAAEKILRQLLGCID